MTTGRINQVTIANRPALHARSLHYCCSEEQLRCKNTRQKNRSQSAHAPNNRANARPRRKCIHSAAKRPNVYAV